MNTVPDTSPETTTLARLLIAEDHALVREGLRAMVTGHPDLEVVGEAENGWQAVELCRSLGPDLVLMDVRMPDMNGLEATRAIKEAQPAVSVLMVTTHHSPDYLLEAIRAGAAGYVLKESSAQDLLDAILRVLGGEPTLDHGLAMRLLERLSGETASAESQTQGLSPTTRGVPPPNPLTPRETEVVVLLATGKTNRQIGQELYMSLSTVKRHVERIIKKLGVSDRTQAAVRAIELGLLPERR